MSRKRFDAVAVGLLLLITTALSAAPCEPALNFARSALRAASLSHGLEQKVASKLNNATRMSHSSNSSGIKNAIQQLDVALSLLSGPEADGVPPEIIAPIRTAITDYRACLASAPPVQTATVTVTVTAADHTAAAGANVRVDNEIVGQTGNDGRFTFAAPAGTQIAITADLDYISGGGLTVTLVAGSTNQFAITLAEESEFAEHNEMAIDEMRDGVLPAAFPSLTLRILDGDKSVTMVSADAVVLETKRGIATDVTSLFSVNKKGEIVAPKPDAVRDVINGYFGPLTFRVMGWDSNNFFYDSRVSFLVGRYGLKGKILPPAGDPTISTANISLGLTGVDGATFWVRTDANGNYAFSSLPKDSYLVRADKITSSITYAVRAPLLLDADMVQDFTLKSPNELFPASSAAQAASNGRVGVKSAEDGTYTIDFPTVGTSPQTQPNTK